MKVSFLILRQHTWCTSYEVSTRGVPHGTLSVLMWGGIGTPDTYVGNTVMYAGHMIDIMKP